MGREKLGGPKVEFQLSQPFEIKFLSYSQRKFMGFRNRFEFDKKRLLMASDKEFCVSGYD